MNETIRLDDMKLFASVVEAGSITAAARRLGIPKQSVSRRVASLERALGTRLLHRTTRRQNVTEAGAAYARRCADITRLAEEANRDVADAASEPRGTLRITADPTFGDAFVTDVVIAYARRWPAVRIDVQLTRRRVDLVGEGFDVAFRVGLVDEADLTGVALGPADVRYCASPTYVARRGAPAAPRDLARHECIVVGHDDEVARWPFRGPRKIGVQGVPITGALRTTSFAMSLALARAGLGIAIAPEFACQADLEAGQLVSVLEAHRVRVGSVWLLHPTRPFLTPRVRAFIALAREHFAAVPFAASRALSGGAAPHGSAPGSPLASAPVRRGTK